jgi:hypothetical protein
MIWFVGTKWFVWKSFGLSRTDGFSLAKSQLWAMNQYVLFISPLLFYQCQPPPVCSYYAFLENVCQPHVLKLCLMVKGHLRVLYDDSAEWTANSCKYLIYHAIHMEHVGAFGRGGDVNEGGIVEVLLAGIAGDIGAILGEYWSHGTAMLCVFLLVGFVVY